MPQHVHPLLRAREDVMEAAGLIQKLNSDGVNNQKSAEAAGQTARVIPACGPIIFNNTSWQPSTTNMAGNSIPNARIA